MRDTGGADSHEGGHRERPVEGPPFISACHSQTGRGIRKRTQSGIKSLCWSAHAALWPTRPDGMLPGPTTAKRREIKILVSECASQADPLESEFPHGRDRGCGRGSQRLGHLCAHRMRPKQCGGAPSPQACARRARQPDRRAHCAWRRRRRIVPTSSPTTLNAGRVRAADYSLQRTRSSTPLLPKTRAAGVRSARQ